jgi:BirA family biotin operon repressor/biotin-[acetyl-CoA-carboxylase] ligase
LVVGTCLVEVLRNEGLEGASLKWPNDVMVGEHKLAGILCEYLPPSSMIVGLGINIDFDTTQPPSPRATALAHLLDPMPSLDSLVAGLVTELLEWVGDDHADVAERTRDRVSAVMSTLGRPVEVQEPSGERWRGGARGLDDAGHLLVVPEGSVEPLRVVASDIEHLYQ